MRIHFLSSFSVLSVQQQTCMADGPASRDEARTVLMYGWGRSNEEMRKPGHLGYLLSKEVKRFPKNQQLIHSMDGACGAN